MENKLISVIIPCYNAEKYIGDTLKSVISQTYKNLEIIVIDDGSTDSSKDVIMSFSDKRISYFYQNNKGNAAARNTGIKFAKGEILAFIDSDDIWVREKLVKQMTLMNVYQIVNCDYSSIDKKGNDITHKELLSNKIKIDFKDKILTGNFILGSLSSVLMTKNIIDDIGLFNENLNVGVDWEFWARILWANYRFGFINERLVKIRVLNDSVQRSASYQMKYKSHKIVLESFLCFDEITKKQKGKVFSKLVGNSYMGRRPFTEIWNYYCYSIKNNVYNSLNWSNLKCIIKYFPRKAYYKWKK